MSSARQTYRSSFVQPFTSGLLLGTGLAACFYALTIVGPLNNPLLRRFALSHWTAAASLAVFFVAAAYLLIKLWNALSQVRLTSSAVDALTGLVDEGCDVFPAERPRWLEASWLSLPATWQASWFGLRLNRILNLQLKRGRRDALEADLQSLSLADGERQRQSYSLVRMIICAIPVLGLLGTTLLLSESHPLVSHLRATNPLVESPVATNAADSNRLKSHTEFPGSVMAAVVPAAYASSSSLVVRENLRSAFDPAVVALALTLVILLAQFVVIGVERDLLERIDHGIEDTMIEFLATDPHDEGENLLVPVKQMTADLIASVQQLVEQQATIWSRSISESQRQWSNWTQAASESIASNLTNTISTALTNHAGRLEKIQDEGSRQIDTRWQQWQTTLSDQARAMSSQQKELIRQTDAIQQLVAATSDLRKLEETIQESVGRIENLSRLEDASHCVGEAVAVLATSLERAGIIRGVPVRPRVVRKGDSMDDDQQRKAA